jgi:lactoylglutathione lyase
MLLDHVAIWTNDLERLRDYYVKYFDAEANTRYVNRETGFESYFLSFGTGARIELMQLPGIPGNLNDPVNKQYLGIIHLAFGVCNMEAVITKSEQLGKAGFPILRGPRKTGDGYFEFETLDPDNNRIEVTTVYTKEK